jgi:hypothetical protein
MPARQATHRREKKRIEEEKEASYSNVSRSLADSDTSLTGFTELRSENAAITVPQPSLVTEQDYKRPSGAPITKASGHSICESACVAGALGKVTDATGLSWQNLRPGGHPGGHPVSTPSRCSSHRYRPQLVQQLQPQGSFRAPVPPLAANSSALVAALVAAHH